jgi:hypothetical protein
MTSDSAPSLDASFLSLLGTHEAIPDEVRLCIQQDVLSEHIQKSPSVSIISQSDRIRFSGQVGAIANGALKNRARSGYLVFGYEMSKVKPVPQGSSITRRLDQLKWEEFTTLLDDLAEELTEPTVALEPILTNDNRYVVVQITSPTGAPTFTKKVDEKGDLTWHVPLWKAATKWQVESASDSERQRLFEYFVRLHFSGVVETEVFERVLRQLRGLAPSESNGFASFLAGLLIDTTPEIRAKTAEAFAYVGGLGSEVRPLISHLLLALLDDEGMVACRAAESLRHFGSEVQVELVVRAIERHTGEDNVVSAALRCVGELGSPSAIEQLEKLYPSLSSFEARVAVDRAITRLYQRHHRPRYVPETRTRFIELFEVFQYTKADELLDSQGLDICLPKEHRSCLQALVRYGAHRLGLDHQRACQALDQLVLGRAEGNPLTEVVARWKDALREAVESTPEPAKAPVAIVSSWLLAELFFVADVSYLSYNYAEWVARLCNFIEQAARYFASSRGVRLSANERKLDPGWVDGHPDVRQRLKAAGHPPKGTINREGLCVVVEGLGSPADKEVVQAIRRFNTLIELRHKGPTAHGTAAITKETCATAYDGTDVSTIIEDVRHLYVLCTGLTLGENPFIALNRDLRWMLSSADEVPIAAARLSNPSSKDTSLAYGAQP